MKIITTIMVKVMDMDTKEDKEEDTVVVQVVDTVTETITITMTITGHMPAGAVAEDLVPTGIVYVSNADIPKSISRGSNALH